LERGSVQFLAMSLDTWTKRCNQTTSAASGGYPGRGGPGGGGPGLGGAGAGGMMGGDDPGSAPGGGAGGPPGFGQKEPKAKNPFDEQPKEVRNARRILQQRLERIHYGLNGFGKKSTATPSKGLFAWADDNQKTQIAKILASIESLQGILNSDKMSSLDKVTSMTRRPIYDLQQACTAITGDDTVALVVPPPTDDSGTDEPSSGDGFGNEN